MGIFSGSGVGKSVLLSMLARNVLADISVIGLVGERGREVQEFLQDDFGPAGLARSVIDLPYMPRAAEAAYLPAINRARQVMATYADMEELIRLGAYRQGSRAPRSTRPSPCTSHWRPSSASLRKN